MYLTQKGGKNQTSWNFTMANSVNNGLFWRFTIRKSKFTDLHIEGIFSLSLTPALPPWFLISPTIFPIPKLECAESSCICPSLSLHPSTGPPKSLSSPESPGHTPATAGVHILMPCSLDSKAFSQSPRLPRLPTPDSLVLFYFAPGTAPSSLQTKPGSLSLTMTWLFFYFHLMLL